MFAAQAQRKLVRKMDEPELNDIVRTGLAQEFSPDEMRLAIVKAIGQSLTVVGVQ